MKIKKVDDKPMVINTKEKAKIHSHEPKGARIAHVCSGALNYVITNKRLASFGLVSMLDYYTERCVTC